MFLGISTEVIHSLEEKMNWIFHRDPHDGTDELLNAIAGGMDAFPKAESYRSGTYFQWAARKEAVLAMREFVCEL